MPLRALYHPDPLKKRLLRHLMPYVTAIVLSVLALLLTLIIPTNENKPFFVLFFGSVVACSWLYGIVSGLLSILLSTLEIVYFIIPPRNSFFWTDSGDIVRLALFVAMTFLIAWMMTKLRKTQQELALEQERFELAHEIAKIWAWELELSSGRFIWSSRSRETSNIQQESTQELFQQIHPDDRERVSLELSRAVENRQPYETEFRIDLPNGEVCWIASMGESYRAPDGEQRIIGVNVDITSRKIADQALESAAKGELAGKLAHEINSPLQSLIHSLYLIRHLTAQTETQLYSELAYTEAERVSQLVNEILGLYAKPGV